MKIYRQFVPKEKFSHSLVKTLNNYDFYQYCFKWLYYYYALFWILVAVINVTMAFKYKSLDILVVCCLWIYLAWINIKNGIEHNKRLKEEKKNGNVR